MEFVHKIEAKLAGLYKGAPKLSDSSKETLVKIWPWLALIGGVLQLLAAWWLYSWAKAANDVTDGIGDFYRSIGVDNPIVDRWTVWLWIGLVVLLIEGVLLLIAYPKLKRRERAGWDLLFLVGLFNVAYAVVSMFVEGRGGFGSLIWNLIVSAVVFWLLFAVRDKYHGAKMAHHAKPVHHEEAPKE